MGSSPRETHPSALLIPAVTLKHTHTHAHIRTYARDAAHQHLQHRSAPYLVIPIPGPPIPMPPPAAAPFSGFMCWPAPGPDAGPPGITEPIIPAAPGSPGCPPPSMLASFPISVSAEETGGRWKEVSGQSGGVALVSQRRLYFVGGSQRIGGVN